MTVEIPAALYQRLKIVAAQEFRTPHLQVVCAVANYVAGRESEGVYRPAAPREGADAAPTDGELHASGGDAAFDRTPEEAARRARAHVDTLGVPPRSIPRTKETISGFRGVYPYGKRWVAKMMVLGQMRVLGPFDDKIEAAHAYDHLARAVHGAKAYLNFPTGIEMGRDGTLDDEFVKRLSFGTPMTVEEFRGFARKHVAQLHALRGTVPAAPAPMPPPAPPRMEAGERDASGEVVEDGPIDDYDVPYEELPAAPAPEDLVAGIAPQRVHTRTPPPGRIVGAPIPPTRPAKLNVNPEPAPAPVTVPLDPPKG